MPRRNRIRRKLTLSVSEPQTGNPLDVTAPGHRFATGWQLCATGHGTAGCGGDPVTLAGYLAYEAAWNAHHHAVNWLDLKADR